MSEPDHVAVMKRAKELCAQDGFVWWELAYEAEPNPLQRLVSDNRRQVYMARARDQLRRERLAAADGLAPNAGVSESLQTHISGRLGHGEAPPPPSTPPGGPHPRMERTPTVFFSAARSAGRMAPLGGLALIGLAAWLTLHSLPPSRSLPGDTPAAALQPALLPLLAPPISPVLPAGVTEARLRQPEAPSAPIKQVVAGPAEHKTVRWRKLHHRSRIIAREAFPPHRWIPVFADRCPYQCSWTEAMRGGDD